MLIYYDQINWINLDPSRTCTFRTSEAVFMKLYASDLLVSYQLYKEVDFKCVLQDATPAVGYKNATWMYSNHVLADTPDICGFLVTIQNTNTTSSKMLQIIRTNAELLKSSVIAIVGAVSALYIGLNL